MNITADNLKQLKLIDDIVPEPLGGAHRDVDTMAQNLKTSLLRTLEELSARPVDDLLDRRYQRLMSYGEFSD